MPSIAVRQLDAFGEPQFGQGVANFIFDLEAVGQLIVERLRLFQGEWWENLLEGLPLWQQILGVSFGPAQQAAASLAIQQRINTTSFVTGLSNVSYAFNSQTRFYEWSCIVNTQFGQVTVGNNIPTPTGQGALGYGVGGYGQWGWGV
jgi:hypothetical protein